MRPADQAGRLSPGYVAVPESSDSIGCDWRSPSPVAVDAGILECGDSWHYGVACWPVARASSVLCDRDPFGRQLARIPAQFTTVGPDTARPPVPFGLELDNGERCKIRDGGAWARSQQEPSFVGYYECGSVFGDAVWALPGDIHGGIDELSPQWTVVVGKASGVGSLVRHRVVTARFVGMAPASGA